MDKIFSSNPGRRLFLTVIVVMITALILLRFLVFPASFLSETSNEIGVSFLEKFATSIFTAVVVGLFLFWIQGAETKKQIEFTGSKREISKQLKSARRGTKSWLFNGGLGRYTRATSLPKLSKMAKNANETISIKIITLNPFNKQLIEDYCNFRLSVDTHNANQWTYTEVNAEILATLLTAFHYRSINRLLDISIAVKDHFSLSRMDISSDLAVITRENPKIPSMIFKKDSYLYKHYIEEFNHAYRHSSVLTPFFMPHPCIVNADTIPSYLAEIFPGQNLNLDRDLLNKIEDKFKKPKNPF